MTVAALIKQLQKLDPKSRIVLQIDPEGNGYHDLRGSDVAIPDGDGGYLDPDWSASQCCLDEEQWAALKSRKGSHVVVLFP